MNNFYFGWQINMSNPSKSVSDALQHYYDRYGLPPQIIEVSDLLEKESLPPDLTLVVNVVHVPKNILLIGE